MIRWLKNFFKITPGEGPVPISPSYVKLREYVYVGDGMMEEVIRQPEKAGNVGPGALPLNSKKLKEHLEARRTSHIDTTPIMVAAAVSSWTGDSSYSSYDSGSCDSSSSSCD
ncbi:hypothetical protein [Escherichia phage IME08]|uniref:Uncharacterized protein mrh.1 n=1 Tax=Escherichia phage IME08 TaxID=698728 RepID=D7RM35_9CAUD|nr:hypothetical protein IME08_gp022 [Escherichia phage IME08]ADI55351.1 hypothetical protein [Escherichia phage IME08]